MTGLTDRISTCIGGSDGGGSVGGIGGGIGGSDLVCGIACRGSAREHEILSRSIKLSCCLNPQNTGVGRKSNLKKTDRDRDSLGSNFRKNN